MEKDMTSQERNYDLYQEIYILQYVFFFNYYEFKNKQINIRRIALIFDLHDYKILRY